MKQNQNQNLPSASRSSSRQKGFSLVELLVATSMLVLISAVSIISYRNGERSKRLQLATDGVINTIRAAQSYTLAGKELTTTCADKAAVYYFVEFNYLSAGSYYIKAKDKCSNVIQVEQVQLPAKTRVKASGLKFNNTVATNILDVQFTLPFAKILGSYDDNTYSNFTTFTTESVIIEPTDGANTKTVTIDGISGRIGE
jgi:prepilin-type N-terminal cleavage/methylation domain-containing protein